MTVHDERGSVTVVVVTITFALLMLGGLVFDGGRIITAQRQADAVAEAAARASAQQLDENSLRSNDQVVIDASAGERRANDYLRDAGYTGTVTINGSVASVTVQHQQSTSLLGLIGFESVTVHGEGSARAVRGITREGG